MITNIILSVIIIICVFIIINLLRKLERIDDDVTETSLQMEDILTDLRKMQSDMLDIDSKGVFQSDDEVGTVFNELKQLIDTINDRYIEDTDGE